MRRARYKSPHPAFYHVLTRVAGSPRYFPLQRPVAQKQLWETIRYYLRAYCCRLVSYKIMGNHYHLILFFEDYRPFSLTELRERAHLLYGRRFPIKTSAWSLHDWLKFNQKLFDISALMQHINGEYAKWFNRRFHRRGHFWADRFKNPELLDLRALQECLFYVELNAVRAGLVRKPEKYKASSARLRYYGQDQELMCLTEIFPDIHPDKVFSFYRSELAKRCGVSSPPPTFTLLQRLRFFSDGLAIGSQLQVGHRINQLRFQGYYRYRKKPIAQLSGYLYTVREQRSHAVT